MMFLKKLNIAIKEYKNNTSNYLKSTRKHLELLTISGNLYMMFYQTMNNKKDKVEILESALASYLSVSFLYPNVDLYLIISHIYENIFDLQFSIFSNNYENTQEPLDFTSDDKLGFVLKSSLNYCQDFYKHPDHHGKIIEFSEIFPHNGNNKSLIDQFNKGAKN